MLRYKDNIWSEIRKLEDLKPISLNVSNVFDLPNDSVYINLWQQKQQEDQQAQAMEGGDQGGEQPQQGAPSGNAQSSPNSSAEEDLDTPEEV